MKACPLSTRNVWSKTIRTQQICYNYTSNFTDEVTDVPSTFYFETFEKPVWIFHLLK